MLVADGWIEYPYAQTLFAAWQAGAAYLAPTVEARGRRRRTGAFCDASSDILPGMARRMSLPLGMLPPGTKELRMRTTQEIYWDRLAVAYAEANALATARVAAARVGATRLPASPSGDAPGDRRPSYDYDRRAPLWDARHPRPAPTPREGPITDLVASEDGAVAIIGPGEELQLEFDASRRSLKPGWTRRFVLDARGWCKDMDLYTKDGDGRAAPRQRAAAATAAARYTTATNRAAEPSTPDARLKPRAPHTGLPRFLEREGFSRAPDPNFGATVSRHQDSRRKPIALCKVQV